MIITQQSIYSLMQYLNQHSLLIAHRGLKQLSSAAENTPGHWDIQLLGTDQVSSLKLKVQNTCKKAKQTDWDQVLCPDTHFFHVSCKEKNDRCDFQENKTFQTLRHSLMVHPIVGQ